MAELGKQVVLLLEFEQHGNNMLEYLAFKGIGQGEGQRSGTIDVDNAHRLVSLVSMIAPSPDWFVGIHDENMCDNSGWVTFRTYELFPYDAGTDSGLKFLSPDVDTQPKEGVHRLTNSVPNITDSSFYGTNQVPHIATLTFNLMSVKTSGAAHETSRVAHVVAVLLAVAVFGQMWTY